MSSQHRRHRSSATGRNNFDVATPRASNNSSGLLFQAKRPSHDATQPTEIDRQHHSGNRQFHLDSMKMQHYQYQEDPHTKRNQQHRHEQGRLQHHHRNYSSEERQTTSECSRGSRSSLTPQRDDSIISHWHTPPRHRGSHNDSSSGKQHQSREKDHLHNQLNNERYHADHAFREGAFRESKMKRSLSSGVADMSKISVDHSYHRTKPSSSGYSKDDTYRVTQQQFEGDLDSTGKKSKSSKGLLSRASHKIKKRLVGSNINNSSSNSTDHKGKVFEGHSGIEVCDSSNSHVDQSGDVSRLSIDISTVQYVREGRDPSPTQNAKQREWLYPLDVGQQKIGPTVRNAVVMPAESDDSIPGMIYDDEGNLVEFFPAVDFCESDNSTLTSHFTYPMRDVALGASNEQSRQRNSQRTKGRPAFSNNLLGTPQREQRSTDSASISSRTHSITKGSLDSKPLSTLQQQNISALSNKQMNDQKMDGKFTGLASNDVNEKTSNISEPPENESDGIIEAKQEFLENVERIRTDDSSVEKEANYSNASLMRDMIARLDSAKASEDLLTKQNTELVRENSRLSTEVEALRQRLLSNDNVSSSEKLFISQLEAKLSSLEGELRKKDEEISRATQQNSSIAQELEKSNKMALQISKDLESYKKECSSHRERVLQSERENAKMEQLVYNERKKVLSLEAENAMLLNLADEKIGSANNAEKAKHSEMNAYKEQCKKYRDNVIQLERKVITAESALEAMGKMASALEQEKMSISAALDECKGAAESLKVELSAKEAKLLSVQEDLITLQSKCSNAEEKINDNERTISALESENYNILRKLDAQSSALVAFQKEETNYKQLELEVISLKKKNDEMQMNEVVLRKQLLDAQDAASNSNRLQKMIADSESFIASVQKDLTEARSKHHQQLIEIRSKHSSEIDNLSNELQKEKLAKREAEKMKNELEDKVLELEVARDQLEQQITNQSKAHEDQSSKLMHQLEEMREMLSGRRDEINSLKRKLADTSATHQRIVAELERNISSLEQQKNQSITAVSTIEKDLKACVKDKQNLKATIEENEIALNDLRNDLSKRDHKANNDIDQLNEVIHGLKHDLESAFSERQVLLNVKNTLQKRILTTKVQILDAVTSLKREKAALASDLQTQVAEVKAVLMSNVKGMVLEYCRILENQQLNQSMNHQVALASLRTEASKRETLLQEANIKSQRLQKSIDLLSTEKEDLSRALKAVCSKLSVPEKDLVDKIDDLQLEISDARSKLATVTIDLTTTKSELAKVGHEKLQLTLDNDHLKEVLSQTKAQIMETEADANDQNEKAQGVIACLEKTLAIKEQEWVETRTALDTEMTHLRNQMDEAIATREKRLDDLRAENQGIKIDANKLKQEWENLNSRLEETQSELMTSKKNLVSLNDQLRDKTETIHNLNDLLARASREAAEELANHYMKIEDELRAQLHSVQCEKESIQKQMTIQNEESERTIEEFFTTKRELSACVEQLSADLGIAQKKLVAMEVEVTDLRKEKEALFAQCSNLSREINVISSKGISSSQQIKNLTSAIEKLNDVHVTSEREHTAELGRIADELIQSHSAEIDALTTKLLDANSKIDKLKSALEDINAEHSCDLKMTIEFYKAELENQKTIHAREIEDKDQEISNLRVEIDKIMSSKSLLHESLKSVEENCLERENQIKQLKASLRDALQNALQADASKRESEDKLAEIADTLSSYEQNEECESTLSGRLVVSFPIKSTIERLLSDKQGLVIKLAESERHLLECQSALTRLELKLTMAGQVNEKLQGEANTREIKLNQLDIENKERETDQKILEDRIKTMQAERQKETETFNEIITRIQIELEQTKRNEMELTEQIMVLKQDCDVETLYGELLDKMKGKEMQYESSIQKMALENDSLRGDIASLTKENEAILRTLDGANAQNTSLTQRLDEANVRTSNLAQRLASVENELDTLQRNESRHALNDEVSITSTLASHRLNQTASELDTTIKEIKKHHETTVQNLQTELKEMRTKLKKSERRVQELSTLLQENSKVIDALHRKLISKKQQKNQSE